MRQGEEDAGFQNLAKCNENRTEYSFNLCFRAMDTQTQITYKPKKVNLQIADAINYPLNIFFACADVFRVYFGFNLPIKNKGIRH